MTPTRRPRTSRATGRPAADGRATRRGAARVRASHDATPARQLRLLDGGDEPEWRLDPHIRDAGRRGVAEAREILRRARPPQPVAKAS
jgi:hypothetical protein